VKTFVIGISGGSASGKTTLAKMICKSLGKDKTNLIPLDNYYRDFVSEGFNPEMINYDNPKSIDISKLASDLKLLLSGRSVEIPGYDFEKHTRMKSGLVIIPRKYTIVEGLFLFNIRSLQSFFDLKLYVDTPEDIRFYRRMERDTKERNRSPVSVRNRYEKFVYPCHIKYVQPNLELADIIIQGDVSFYGRLHEILGLINSRRDV
jgi:uridine kinase